MDIRGSIDAITASGAVGWIFISDLEQAPLVEARFQGIVIGETIANQFRPDLAAAGIGDGYHGFQITFTDSVDPATLPSVQIHVAGCNLLLPRTPSVGLYDFLQEVTGRYPGAGRSRSLYGGLWVDRPDALRLLEGRLASGATPVALGGYIRDFIQEGALKLRGAIGTDDFATLNAAGGDASVSGVSSAIFHGKLLQLLRALLDDNPTIVSITAVAEASASFTQPSTLTPLPSPAECLLILVGNGCAVDYVADSHMLPEFTIRGQSRWTPGGAPVGVEIAEAQGATVKTLDINKDDVVLVDPGTIFRFRQKAGSGVGLALLFVPKRQTPLHLLVAGQEPIHVGAENPALAIS